MGDIHTSVCDQTTYLICWGLRGGDKNEREKTTTREDVGRKYLKYHDITDFPTTMFWVNNQVKFKVCGSKHPNMILRWIDLYLV